MKAIITIPGKGQFILPVISTNDKGITCRTGPKDSPATEWFPYESSSGTTATIMTEEEEVI